MATKHLCVISTPLQFISETKHGKHLSAPLAAILIGLLLSAVGILPISCGAYDGIWKYVLPIAAAMYLLESDLQGWDCRMPTLPMPQTFG